MVDTGNFWEQRESGGLDFFVSGNYGESLRRVKNDGILFVYDAVNRRV